MRGEAAVGGGTDVPGDDGPWHGVIAQGTPTWGTLALLLNFCNSMLRYRQSPCIPAALRPPLAAESRADSRPRSPEILLRCGAARPAHPAIVEYF